MRIIDISREISGKTVVYPGDDPVVLERPLCIGPDSPVNMSRLACTTHTATHLDAPLHMLAGSASINDFSLTRFILPARVIAVTGDRIGPDAIPEREAVQNRALLFKMPHRDEDDTVPYERTDGWLPPETAELAVTRGAALVGVESLSVDPVGSEDFPAHRVLLAAGVLILEGLDLRAAPPGDYTLIALPLKLKDADGAPVRAVLVEDGMLDSI